MKFSVFIIVVTLVSKFAIAQSTTPTTDTSSSQNTSPAATTPSTSAPTTTPDGTQSSSSSSSSQSPSQGTSVRAQNLQVLESVYGLTADQVKSYNTSGLNDRQLLAFSEIAKESSKTLDEIISMAKSEKLSQLLKDLGLNLKDIQKALKANGAVLRSKEKGDKKEEKKEHKHERKENKEDRREDKEERKEDRKSEHREDRKEERREDRKEDHKDNKKDNQHTR